MKKISFLSAFLFISLPLVAAQTTPQSSCWARVKNYVASLVDSPSLDNEEKESGTKDMRSSNDFDDERTLGDYYFKYGLVTFISFENALLSRLYIPYTKEILDDMHSGNSFNAILQDRQFDYYGRIDIKNLSELPISLRVILYFVFNILDDERFSIKKSEKDVIVYLMEHKYRLANPEQKKVLKRVIGKLESASKNIFKNDVAAPLLTQMITDGIQKGAYTASVKTMGTDVVSPFKDTIAAAIKQQTLYYLYNNKKFKISSRDIGESLLTDICYTLAKYKFDQRLERTYGFTCKYPWSKRSNMKHYLAGNFLEGYARHQVKDLMRNYLVKPCISAIFGKPEGKNKKIKKTDQNPAPQQTHYLWDEQPRSHE